MAYTKTLWLIKRIPLLGMILLCVSPSSTGQPAGRPPLLQGGLVFRLEFDRMFPKQVTVPPGQYLIQVDNGMVVAPISIVLTRGSGQNVAAKNVSAKSSRSRFVVSLDEGNYTLLITGYPKWSSQIAVKKN